MSLHHKKMNKIKSEQLEIPFSTANQRLRKMIMFKLVQECGRDNCYRCKEKITDIDNFSIEHMEDWLHTENPKELFFDLNNIAFSHHKCNTSRGQQMKKVGKSGFKGVSFDKSQKREKRWRSVIYVDGKKINIGRFSTPEDAARAYDEKVIELYGNKAITNKYLGHL